MKGKFCWKKFRDVDLSDPFFDSLKQDYSEFSEWFDKKRYENAEALVYDDETGVGAFLYLKEEYEPIQLDGNVLPECKRIKIGTLRLSEKQRNIRLGEGTIGIALWKWQESKADEIYLTIFEKHDMLVRLFEKFGFVCKGKNLRGEAVYVKSRKELDYSNPYKSFPFIRPSFTEAGLIPIFESFHDRLFPFSELMGNNKEIEEITAGNGITKIYIGTPWTAMHYHEGEPVVIYRIFEGERGKTYKSAVTSFATIVKTKTIKSNGKQYVSLDDYIALAGNKTVFTKEELKNIYIKYPNVEMLALVYNGFFGKGNNVNHKTLKDKGLFTAHPYNIVYNRSQFVKILEMGRKNVQNIIIDQS